MVLQLVPRISVGLPVFNGEAYLRRALDSLLTQDFESFELIICDNASTDATESICREFAARDSRVAYYRNPTNIGASANYNRVFTLARAPFFKWASHDDECHPSLLRRCLEALEAAPPSTVLAFPQCAIIDENGGITEWSPDTIRAAGRPHARLASLLFHAKYAHGLWGLIRSDALRRTRLMGTLEADHVVLAELALLGDMVEIPEVLYRLRRHPHSAMNRCTARELLQWHDPTASVPRILLPHWIRVQAEYFRAIRHAPLTPAQRMLCWGALPAVPMAQSTLRWTGGLRHRLGLYRRRPPVAADVPRPPVVAESSRAAVQGSGAPR
jgi:glycosyltransferase involved in cell wall biosynthesis